MCSTVLVLQPNSCIGSHLISVFCFCFFYDEVVLDGFSRDQAEQTKKSLPSAVFFFDLSQLIA